MMKSLRLSCAAVCAVLVLSINTSRLAVASVPSGDGWKQLESENFIVFSNLTDAATQEIGLDLERLRAVLEEIFPNATFESPLDTLIYIFRDRETFEPYALPGGQSGYFAPHKHANFAAVVGSNPDETLPVVYRQYLHDVVNNNVPQVPLWFKHGLAEIFSTFEADDAVAQVALAGTAADGLGLAGSSRMPVGEVLSLETLPTDGEGMSAFVQGSWALMHYLLVDDEERFEATRRFVGQLDADPTSSISITEVLGVDSSALEASVGEYLQQSPFPHREMAVPASVPKDVSLTPMEPHLALFHLGDLLIHVNPDRGADAEARFRSSLEISPDFAPSIAGLGLVSEEAGDLTTAEKYYSQALEGLADAFRLQVLFGEVELGLLGKRRPQNPEEQKRLDQAVAAFEKSVELRPGYGEGWALLGYAYNLEPKPSPDAVATLEKAYEMLPGRGDVAYNLLLGYARAGKRQEAIDLVATAEARGVSEERLSPARQTLLQLDFQYAVALAREKKYDEAAVLLEKVQAEATNDSMRQQAADLLKQIKP
jgi:tetratricopeptide (TPR) repeat protein